MNLAALLLTSALSAGGNVTQIGWGEGPIVQAGCSSCEAAPAPSCDSCGSSKIGLLDKLKARFAPKPKCNTCDSCAPAPAPACAPAPAPTCDACAAPSCCETPTLLDKLKARFARKKSSCCEAPACDSCGAAPAAAGCATPGPAVTAPITPAPPKEMPKAKEAAPPPKAGATGNIPVPAVIPSPVALPALPVVPSSGSSSPY